MRKSLLSFTLTLSFAALCATAPARADAVSYAGAQLDQVGRQLDAVWNFLGATAPDAGALPAPVESTPAVWLRPVPRFVEAVRAPVRVSLRNITLPAAVPVHVVAKPTVEKTPKKLTCVEYARALSNLAIFGDAKTWWERAKSLYARASQPVEDAVMVFSGSARLKSGHVAVVSDIVSPREIRVEQANWLNKGEIDHATPVLDVSAGNDWSKVRVWDVPSRQFGSRVYAISGFILKPMVREAANN